MTSAAVEAYKAMVRRWVEEGVNQGELAAYDAVFADTILSHSRQQTVQRTVDELKQNNVTVRAAFPDRRRTVEDIIAEGDRVVLRFTDRGTHRGEYAGFAPTGKPMTLTGILIWRISGGKVVEQWLEEDMLGVMQQFGAELRPPTASPNRSGSP